MSDQWLLWSPVNAEAESFVAGVARLAPVSDSPDERESASRSVVLVDGGTGELARRAAEAGAEATLVSAETFERAVSLALEQLLELQKLRLTHETMRPIERAKGILMERYGISEQPAYELLRRHARNANLRLSEMAEAILDSHHLFTKDARP
jgi:AmiR/NasT family two-component response regulator